MLKKLFLFSMVCVLMFSFTSSATCQEENIVPTALTEARRLLRRAEQEQNPALYEGAIEKLQELIKEKPEYVRAYTTLAEIYERQNKIVLAKQIYEEALGLNSQDPLISLEILHFYFMHDFLDKAESLAKECILKFPDEDLKFKKYLVYVYMKKGQMDKAKEIVRLDEKLANDPEFKIIAKGLETLPDPRELELMNSILDKIEAIEQKIESNPQKYSYLHEKVYPYTLSPFNKDIKELKEINNKLQSIIDNIKE